MEGGEEVEQNLGHNEVLEVTLGAKEGSDDFETFESESSGSFSRYLRIEPPIPQLPEFQSLKQSQPMSTTATYSSHETTKLSPTLNKSKKVATESVTRRRSMARSAYSKPKSRLVETSYPSTWKLVEESIRSRSPNRTSPNMASSSGSVHASIPKENVRTGANTPKTPAPITPKTPLVVSLIEEDDEDDDDDKDDDVYKTGYLQIHGVDLNKQGKKLKIMLLIESIAFVCIMGFLIASLTIHKLRNLMIWSSQIWKFCVLVLVIFCGRLVTEWCSKVLILLIERNFFMKKKVLYFVYSLKFWVRVLIWLGLVLLAWALLINHGIKRSRRTTRILNYITKALASSLIGAAMWALKILLVKLLASSFHVNRFFDMIQESIFHQYVLQTLSGPPLMNYAESVGSSRTSGRLSFRSMQKGKQVEKEEVIDVEKLHKMKREKISAWTMGGLIQLIRTSHLSTISDALDESVDEDSGEQKEKKITSEWEAKAAAYRIFKNVAKHGSMHIDEEDLLRFMNRKEVDNVLPLFEGVVQTAKIKKVSFCNWVVNVYNERKCLAHSLNDTKTAIEELNKIVSGILLILIFIVWLLLMGFVTTNVLVFISAQLLVVVFVIGDTCKTVFEALVFVFVLHPFDVGDRCIIDGVQMVVEKMNILTTIFLRHDNEKIFYPNSVLATKPISNFNRSPEMSDSVEFAVDVSTSAANIVALKEKIKVYLESKPQHWSPDHSVQINEIEDMNKMKMGLYVTHTINFQNDEEKSNRRSELVFHIKKIFEDLGIKYHLPPQQVYIRYVGSPAPTDATVTL